MNIITDKLPLIENKSSIIFKNNKLFYVAGTKLFAFNIYDKNTKLIYDTKTEYIHQVFLINEKIYFSSLSSVRLIEGTELRKKFTFDSKILKITVNDGFIFVLTENALIKIDQKFKREILKDGEYLDFSVDNTTLFLYRTEEILKISGSSSKKYEIIEGPDEEVELFECVGKFLILGYKTYLDVYKIEYGVDLTDKKTIRLIYRLDMIDIYRSSIKESRIYVYNQQGVFSLSDRPLKVLNKACQFIDGEVVIFNGMLVLLNPSGEESSEPNITIDKTKDVSKYKNTNTFKCLKDIQADVIDLFSPLLNLANKEEDEFKVEYNYQLSRILLQVQCVQKMIPEKLEILKENFDVLIRKTNMILDKRSCLLNKLYVMYEELKNIENKYMKQVFVREFGKDFMIKYSSKIKEWEQFEKRLKSQNSVLKEVIRAL